VRDDTRAFAPLCGGGRAVATDAAYRGSRQQRYRVQVLRSRRDARPDRRARSLRPASLVPTAGLRSRHLRREQQPVLEPQRAAARLLEPGARTAAVPARRVPARLGAPRRAAVRVVSQRHAVGPTLAQEPDRGPGPVLPGPGRRAVVPARGAEQDEKVLRPVGRVQRDERRLRVFRPARRRRPARRHHFRISAVRGRRVHTVGSHQRVALARQRRVARRRTAAHRRRRHAPAPGILSGTRAGRHPGTAHVDRFHVRAPARRRPRDQELPRGHPVHAVPAGTVAVRVLLGRHPGGQLHAAQHLSRAPLEVPSQPRRLSAGRRPVPGLRPTVRRQFARTAVRLHR